MPAELPPLYCVPITGGYCWSFDFHVTRLLLLRWLLEILGAVPLSRETDFSLWEEGRDTIVVLLDSRYGL
jgi:hypothetical protein